MWTETWIRPGRHQDHSDQRNEKSKAIGSAHVAFLIISRDLHVDPLEVVVNA